MSEDLRVQPVAGEPFRYLVRSFSKPDVEYLVDLAAEDAVGICGCPFWHFRIGPKVAQGQRIRCRHLNAARVVALDDLIRRLEAAMGQTQSQEAF